MRMVLQTVKRGVGIDFDPVFIDWATAQALKEGIPATFILHDVLEAPPPGEFDAAYSLDVIEHIEPPLEDRFVANIAAALKPDGVCFIGTPNITSAPYASEPSRIGHINLKSAETLSATLLRGLPARLHLLSNERRGRTYRLRADGALPLRDVHQSAP